MHRRAIGLVLSMSLACTDEPPTERLEPMRVPSKPPSARQAELAGSPGHPAVEGGEEPEPTGWIAERPPTDPEIDRALDLIEASELRFVDPSSEPDEPPTEYTGKDFASLLRTKWDWIGYDLVTLEPWLDGVATRSFKTQLTYQVVLADGRTSELRPWLEAALRTKTDPEPESKP